MLVRFSFAPSMDAPQDDAVASSARRDPAWKYNFLADPNDKNAVTCKFCLKVSKGGIYRAKQHQIGGYKNVADCRKCPVNVKEELRNLQNEKRMQKELTIGGRDISTSVDEVGFDDDEHELDPPTSIAPTRRIPSGSSSSNKKLKGTMDAFVTASGRSQLRQSNIKEGLDKDLRRRTIQKIARFFYNAGIAFNCCKLDSFKGMVQAIGEYGPNLKPPSYHEIRVPLLKDEVKYTEQLMEGHKEEWAQFGCSIMSDCWTDRKHRSIINFMVNCTKGTMFVESIDASSIVKTGEKIYEMLDSFVEKIGEDNVVQVITDNGSNYVLAGMRKNTSKIVIYFI